MQDENYIKAMQTLSGADTNITNARSSDVELLYQQTLIGSKTAIELLPSPSEGRDVDSNWSPLRRHPWKILDWLIVYHLTVSFVLDLLVADVDYALACSFVVVALVEVQFSRCYVFEREGLVGWPPSLPD